MYPEMRSKYEDKEDEVMPYLREEDMANVAKMFLYLSSHGLKSGFHGSVLSGKHDYQDVDIVAEGKRLDIFKAYVDITCGDLERFISGAEWELVYPNRQHKKELYCGLDIDVRFKIKAGKTLIDLCMMHTNK